MKSLLALAVSLTLGTTGLIGAESAPHSFSVEITGQGRPVILIPGLSSSGAVWNGTVAHLKDHYECHVLTLAGFAGQPRIQAPFLETVRNDLATYITAHHLDHPIIIGHSLGGFLTLWLASQHPDLPGPLVIVDALPFLPAVYNPAATVESSKPMAAQMRSGLAAGGPAFLKQSEMSIRSMVTKPADVDLVMSWAKTTDPAAAADGMYDMMTNDLRSDIAKINSPSLELATWIGYRQSPSDTAIRGQVEQSFRAQYAQLKACKIVLADDARHFIMLDDPTWFYKQVDAFLANNPLPSQAH